MEFSGFFSPLVLFLIIAIIIDKRTYSFNIEEREPIVKRPPEKQSGWYFGFSVAQHRTTAKKRDVKDNWILVGAPLGKNSQPGTNNSGALFKCPVVNKNDQYDCIQITTDGKRFDDFDYKDVEVHETSILSYPGTDEIKEGQWLGVSVKSQKAGGRVMVCAHRYIQSIDLNLHHYGMGLCYLLNNQLETIESLEPCKGRLMDKLHQQFGYCQVGTSLALLDDGFALMGSPGPYTWRGTIFGREVVGDFLNKDSTIYRGPLNDDPEPIDKYSYLGMSVAGGRFFQKNFTHFVSGAPHSKHSGEVLFFEKTKGTEELQIVYRIKGKQFASSFGYEILATDLNRDGYDDLLVAAPFFYDGDKYGGAVYLYTNLRDCLERDECEPVLTLKGTQESRFGFALTSIGDINKDGYTDIAIGAPYTRGGGSIYIYLGSREGLVREPSQVIHNKDLSTLGYSLSGGLDMDNNDYPDLLVGNYQDDMAILFKTRPVVDISISIRGDELNNINASQKGCTKDPQNTESACFSFLSCFVISDDNSNTFDVRYKIKEIDTRSLARSYFRNEKIPYSKDSFYRGIVKVDRTQKEYCQEHTIYIKDGIGDILTPLKYSVNYTMANNEVDSAILNKTSTKQFQAAFQKSCGDDDICESNLNLEAKALLDSSDEGYILDLGQHQEFVLDVNIVNKGESAYEANLFVEFPADLSYIALINTKNKTSDCSPQNDTLVVCSLGNPFQENRSARLQLRFEVKSTKKQSVDISVFVNSTSTELSTKTSDSLTVVLRKIALFTIDGKGLTPNFFYSGAVRGESSMEHFEDIGFKVVHQYTITNNAQWQMQDLQIKIYWPYQVNPKRHEEGKWLLYLEQTPTIDRNSAGGINYCSVDPPEAVNKLKLTAANSQSDPAVTTTTTSRRIITETHENRSTYSSLSSSSSSSSQLKLRRKRDVDDVVQPQTVNINGKKRDVVFMDCISKSARCATINCKISYLNKNDQVKIKIHSRIWNSTLIEDYSKVDWVNLTSNAEVIIPDQTILISDNATTKAIVETIAYPDIVLDANVNIWIIVGSVIAGILLLILLVFILYKCGFFKRNRVKDHTLSGNLQKQGENENLLKSKGGKS